MNARAVPCAVRAINRNIASGCRQPAGSYTRANRACLSHTRSNSQNALNKFRARWPNASLGSLKSITTWRGHIKD